MTYQAPVADIAFALKHAASFGTALGEHIYTHLVDAQKQEWDEFRKHVSQWERERYLEIY